MQKVGEKLFPVMEMHGNNGNVAMIFQCLNQKEKINLSVFELCVYPHIKSPVKF